MESVVELAAQAAGGGLDAALALLGPVGLDRGES